MYPETKEAKRATFWRAIAALLEHGYCIKNRDGAYQMFLREKNTETRRVLLQVVQLWEYK